MTTPRILTTGMSRTIILTGTISAALIVDIAYYHIKESSLSYAELYKDAEELLRRLIGLPHNGTINEGIILECIITELMYLVTHEGEYIRNTSPYEGGLPQSLVIDAYSDNIRSIIDDVSYNILEDSYSKIKTLEGPDVQFTVSSDMNSIKLSEHQIATFNPETVDTIVSNNTTVLDIRANIKVLDMFFDYLWNSRILEDIYYYLRDITQSGDIEYNVVSNSLNFYPTSNGEYYFTLSGTISY